MSSTPIGGSNPTNPFAFNLGDVTVNDDDTDDGSGGVKGKKGPKETAAAATTTTDVVITTPPPQQPGTTSTTGSPGDGNDPIRTDAVGGTGNRADPTAVTNLLSDVSSAYGQEEQSIEVMYNKLIHDANSQQDQINDQIQQLDKQIQECKDQMKKLDLVMAKIEELLPKFMEMVGEDQRSRGCLGQAQDQGQKADFAQYLVQELKKAGVDIDPAKISELVDGMAKGGAAGMAVAMFLVSSIAEADADIAMKGGAADPGAPAGSTVQPDNADDPNDFDPANPQNAAPPGTPTSTTSDATSTTSSDDTSGVSATSSTDSTTTLPPEAQAAGFDKDSFAQRLDDIADKAETYAQAPDQYEPSFWGFAFEAPNPQYTQASNNLMDAMFPGASTGQDLALTSDYSDGKQNGVTVQGFSLSGADLQTANALQNLPFGLGPQAATQFLEGRFMQQFEAKIDKLNTQIEALRGEKKALQAQIKDIDGQIDQLEEAKQKALADVEKQKQQAIQQVQQMLQTEQMTVNQVKDQFTNALIGSLDSISAAISAAYPDNATTTSLGSSLIR